MTKPFRHLKAKGETKPQALLRLADFSRFGAMAQIVIVNALGTKFGELEYARRETNTDKIKQALKFAPAATIKAVQDYCEAVKAAGLEKIRADFAKGAAFGIHPDSWHGACVEIADALAACEAPAKAA